MLRNNLMLPTEALDIPEAIDFDGTNDYLSRSSDLTGNADGKTFTFSAWVWWNGASTQLLLRNNSGYVNINVSITNVSFLCANSAGVTVLQVGSGARLPANTWCHVLGSFDMTNTANRHLYVNDVSQTGATWTTYNNDTIDFTRANWTVGAAQTPSNWVNGRLSNVFLDYTYRNLTVEANRRLFITADRKPAANQQALNPILYLPLNDPTQPGKNLGTGGDFALNGVVARSGRGPNQYNAPYSDLDGAADYLSHSDAFGATATTFTISFSANLDDVTGDKRILRVYNPDSFAVTFNCYFNNNKLRFVAKSSSGTVEKLNCETGAIFVAGRNYTVVASFSTNNGLYGCYVNGESVALTGNTGGNPVDTIYLAGQATVGGTGNWFNGKLGRLWMKHETYINLSVSSNLAKFVTGKGIDAKPVDLGANGELPTGVSPEIYLPMYGNNAGKNYGTGGDFTVNSGPFTGARGPNEFWGNKADFDGSTGYLARTSALTGVVDGKTFSLSVWVCADTDADQGFAFSIDTAAGVERFFINVEKITTNTFRLGVHGRNATGTEILYGVTGMWVGLSTMHHVCMNIDLSNTSLRSMFLDNVSSATWATYTNDTIEVDQPYVTIGAERQAAAYGNFFIGKLSEFYFTTDYIDFSQEANRLKFRDAFGNPVELQSQIDAGTLPKPAIYMRFDPNNKGKNSGTGGDFTVNGTITDGGQL